MRRSILYAQEQGRSYDFLSFERDALYALGMSVQDLLGSSSAIVAGLVATASAPASLVVNIAAGRIYQLANVDTAQFGTLGQDTRQVIQQGYALAQALNFSTAGLSAGQSRWALVQATFTQTDVIPSDDPNAGILNYWNVDNPANPLVGPGNTGASQPTRRDGICTLTIKYGAPATSGSEAAPLPDAGNIGLYLIDLTYGQTQITTGQILTAGPSVGTGVSGSYPVAPFLAGLLNAHHSGKAGQAPQIDLTAEVKNKLPLGNLPASSAAAGGGISITYGYAGNPNTHVAGVAGVAGVSPPDFCIDLTNNMVYFCATTGNAAAAVWTALAPLANPIFTGNVVVPTNATTDNSTKAINSAWFQNWLAANTYSHTFTGLTTSSTQNSAHGKTGAPKRVSAFLVCTSADQGYAAGQQITIPSDVTEAIWSDATNVGISISNTGISTVPAAGGATVGVTLSKWNIVVTAYWY